MRDSTDIARAAGTVGITREELLRRAAVGGGALLLGGGLVQGVDIASAAASTPKRGGTFRLGASGGSAKDIIDGQFIITDPDIARVMTGWETLVVFDQQ